MKVAGETEVDTGLGVEPRDGLGGQVEADGAEVVEYLVEAAGTDDRVNNG